MSQTSQLNDSFNIYNRYRFLTILNAAIDCREFQFAKQASMLWLVNYPGDLHVQYFQGLSFANLSVPQQANQILKSLVEKDPHFVEPCQALTSLADTDTEKDLFLGIYNYLTNNHQPEKSSQPWLISLDNARNAYINGEYEKTLDQVHSVLISDPPTAIPAILHLKTAYKMQNQDMLRNLCEIYLEKWPNCLQINIIKALVDMDSGFNSEAVERLHWAAAHDSSGQVINRLMGKENRFKDLWPDRLEIYFDLPIPASVTSTLGWNKLEPGISESPTFKDHQIDDNHTPTQIKDPTQDIQVAQNQQISKTFINEIIGQESLLSTTEDWATADEISEVKSIFSNLAKRYKQPDLERTDNRYPVYVVMSSKKQLEITYGPNTAGIIDELLKDMIGLIQNLPDWDAALFYPDDPALMAQYGLKPIIATDAWQVKLALTEFDQALASKGEMIGALLIVGGPDILPYHHLPNPTLDNDLDVPSDNPYMTIDENYFIPQWPAGRLPGESGSDAGLLLHQIRQITYHYEQRTKKGLPHKIEITQLLNRIIQFFTQITRPFDQKGHLGYSAEIWKAASSRVFRTIGKEKDLNLSPPIDADSLTFYNDNQHKLGYFNLHGVKDGPHWYGQKDFLNGSTGPDYPIAVSPELFSEDNPSPNLILSEACYGANVIQKKHVNALSLKCLVSGTETFVGSTCIAYGSLMPPLVAADFLADKFWQNVLTGQAAGYALMQAKLSLAEEMVRTQGFLDGEDQKTILSFVLFGDPLAVHEGLEVMPKPLFRLKDHPIVKTISDSDMETKTDRTQLPGKVNKEVKKTIEKYLPGLQNANMQFNRAEFSSGDAKDFSGKSGRYMVTLNKSFEQNQHTTHHHFARLTFNEQGKLLKFTTSR